MFTPRDYITVWRNKGLNAYGEHSYDEPIQMLVRWVDKVETIITREANEEVSRTQIYFLSNETLSMNDRVINERFSTNIKDSRRVLTIAVNRNTRSYNPVTTAYLD